jgi:hypothetical protein
MNRSQIEILLTFTVLLDVFLTASCSKELENAPKMVCERGQSGISDSRDSHGWPEVFVLTSPHGSSTSSDLISLFRNDRVDVVYSPVFLAHPPLPYWYRLRPALPLTLKPCAVASPLWPRVSYRLHNHTTTNSLPSSRFVLSFLPIFAYDYCYVRHSRAITRRVQHAECI